MPQDALRTWNPATKLATDPLNTIGIVCGVGYIVNEYLRLVAAYPVLAAVSPATTLALLLGVCALLGAPPVTAGARQLLAPLLVLVFAGLVSLTQAENFVFGEKGFTNLGTMLLGTWLIAYVMGSDTGVRWALVAYFLSNLKLSVFQIRQFGNRYAAAETAGERAAVARDAGGVGTSFFGNSGDFGVAMCTILPLALYLALNGRNWYQKAIGWFMTAAFSTSIVYSGARGNLLGLAVGVLPFVLRSRRATVAFAIVAVGLPTLWFVTPPEFKARIFATGSTDDTTTTHRMDLWRAGVHMFADHPLTGVGIANFGWAYASQYYRYGDPSQFGQRWVPHNILVQASSEMGLLGLAGVVLIGATVWKQHRYWRRWVRSRPPAGPPLALATEIVAESALWGFLSFLVGGMFLAVLYYPMMYYTAALSAMAHSALREHVARVSPEFR